MCEGQPRMYLCGPIARDCNNRRVKYSWCVKESRCVEDSRSPGWQSVVLTGCLLLLKPSKKVKDSCSQDASLCPIARNCSNSKSRITVLISTNEWRPHSTQHHILPVPAAATVAVAAAAATAGE
eukprot:1136867-Pelagomonas_calceolata.AAC.2